MLSNNKIKWIRALEQKKYRKETGCFVVEGEKMVKELLNSSFKTMEVYATQTLFTELQLIAGKKIEIQLVSEPELERISQLKTPNQVLAVAQLPEDSGNIELLTGLSIALDNIQDPGNMGTIIRTAAWFGIKDIFCSPDTVDVYNPKVVQASMGALFKVNLKYVQLESLLIKAKAKNIPIFGTRLNGTNLYKKVLPKDAIILMGNESKGLSVELSSKVDENLMIPSFPAEVANIESLNVSIATAVICAEFRRQMVK